MSKKLAITCYSDVLCVWAYIAQIRIDEVNQNFSGDVSIDYRFCSVFGDTAHKIGKGWAQRGGYSAFGNHVQKSVALFDHIKLHPEIWQDVRPVSSTPAHLLLKAVQRVANEKCTEVMQALRHLFFNRCKDISRWPVLCESLETAGVPLGDVQEVIESGVAYADLEADRRDQQILMIQGSPTFILDGGRQKLYGNVSYRVIETNIKELLREPDSGAASWC